MSSAPLRRALALAACLLLAAPAWGAADGAAPRSAAETLADARALVDAGRFAEALAALRPLTAGRAVEADALFLYGLAATGAARRPGLGAGERDALLDEAVAAFRTMLIDRPDLTRVRLELARAFFEKGEDALARRHFEHALAGDLPPAVAANVGRFLRAMRARKRWTAHFGAALAPDSNVNAASSDRTIWLDTVFGRLPFTLGEESAPRSGIGLSLWGGGEYQYPLGPAGACAPAPTPRAGSTGAAGSTAPGPRSTWGRAG